MTIAYLINIGRHIHPINELIQLIHCPPQRELPQAEALVQEVLHNWERPIMDALHFHPHHQPCLHYNHHHRHRHYPLPHALQSPCRDQALHYQVKGDVTLIVLLHCPYVVLASYKNGGHLDCSYGPLDCDGTRGVHGEIRYDSLEDQAKAHNPLYNHQHHYKERAPLHHILYYHHHYLDVHHAYYSAYHDHHEREDTDRLGFQSAHHHQNLGDSCHHDDDHVTYLVQDLVQQLIKYS
mmetsp:Transcript_14173/g.16873  ORF Transcript_14173/g.16873 Transcript_14173/m.16873 type:complete len:237 (+) Transcript_14173:1374-2084(+)